MNARKSIFVIVCLAVLTISSPSGMNQQQKSTPSPCKIADGGAPLPPIPHGGGNSYVV
jgi:hypothetical protein